MSNMATPRLDCYRHPAGVRRVTPRLERGYLTQSDKRLLTSIGVLGAFGVVQLIMGLPIAGLAALAGALVLVLVFVVTKR